MRKSGPVLKKRDLEIALQSLEPLARQSPVLEQYPTPPGIAADILFKAKIMGDIDGRKVLDLGCGNGIFAIGASLMGAGSVMGIDIDPGALAIADRNAQKMGLDIVYEEKDVANVDIQADVVFQNPPFGSQNRHADRPFLEKAMECSGTVYTIHMSETVTFVTKTAARRGFDVSAAMRYDFEIRHTFDFHTREKKIFDVTMFRLKRRK